MRNYEAIKRRLIAIGIIMALLPWSTSKADVYLKIGTGYIIDQPSRYNFKYTDDTKGSLNTNYGDYSVNAEQGIQIGQFSSGIYESYTKGSAHNPSKVELFVDYDWLESDYNLITGIGYKLSYQDYVEIDGKKNHYSQDKSDKISARIVLSKTIKSFEVGVAHHSQWFRGAPFSDEWEYHRTELFVSYKFSL